MLLRIIELYKLLQASLEGDPAPEARSQLAWSYIRLSRLTAEAVRRLDTCPVPTLALIQGGCFGGGTGIAAACDVVVASQDAIFSISETRWGLMAGIILPQLCRAMGVRQVRRYALTGER